MNNKELTTFDLLIESHLELDRQGPGSEEATLKALSFIDGLNDNSKIADIGCGTGGQTITLAKNAPGTITGVDMISDFIDIFNNNVKNENLQDRVLGTVGDASKLSFNKGELDLIWSEGMIDSLGFEKTLRSWNSFIKTGGYISVTSPSFISSDRFDDLEKFWLDAGSGLYPVEQNIKSMQNAGYSFVTAFTLKEECWTENYYIPRSKSEHKLLEKYKDNKLVKDYIKDMKYETELYEKYKHSYGYVFYIGKKL